MEHQQKEKQGQGKTAKRYSSEFKIDAVKLVLNESYSVAKAAERLGVSHKTLSVWKQQYEEGRLVVGKKQAQATPEEQELRRLREELRQTRLENEILKKASAYFAKNLL
jgi:transposase